MSNNLMDQLNQQRALIDSLMSDREKVSEKTQTLLLEAAKPDPEGISALFSSTSAPRQSPPSHILSFLVLVLMVYCVCPKLESLEDMFMNLTSPDRETTSEAASGTVDSDDKAFRELRQQISFLR